MSTHLQLANGTVDALLHERYDFNHSVLLQCIGVAKDAAGRCSIGVSDGHTFCKAFLLSSMVDLVDEGDLKDGAYFKLQSARVEYMPSSKKYPRVLIITGLRVVGCGPRSGTPQRWEPHGGVERSTSAQTGGGSQPVQEGLPTPNPLLRKRRADSLSCKEGSEATRPAPSKRQESQGRQETQSEGGSMRGQETSSLPATPQARRALHFSSPEHGAAGPSSLTVAERTRNHLQHNAPVPRPLAPHVVPRQSTAEHNSAHPSSGGRPLLQGQSQDRGQHQGVAASPQAASQPQKAPSLWPLTPEGVDERKQRLQAVVPITSLNPYRRRWTIKARVVQKSELRPFSNARGQGKFFTADLQDADGDQIRAKAFNQDADRFFGMMEEDTIVLVSGSTVRPADKRFNELKHPFELTLEEGTIVEPCSDDCTVPHQLYQIKHVSDLDGMAVDSMVDVLALVTSTSAAQHITTKAGKEICKRSLLLHDQSGCSIEMTLWGGPAENIGAELEQITARGEQPVVAVKSGRIGEWMGGPIIASTNSTRVSINPNIPAAALLRDWYENVGHELEPRALSRGANTSAPANLPRFTIADALSIDLKDNESKEVQVEATITYIDRVSLFYPSCSLRMGEEDRICRKRVVQCPGGEWWCERCEACCVPEWRYGIRVHAADWTSHMEMKAFQEGGRGILGGIEANELRTMQEGNPGDFDTQILATHCKQMLLHLKLAKHTWKDREQVQAIVQRAEPIHFIKEGRLLLQRIHEQDI